MAYVNTFTRADDFNIDGRVDEYVCVEIGNSRIGLLIEEAERLHMQLGEVLAKLRPSNDEGPTAPASQVAA